MNSAGIGLGLTIVKQIVESADGRINVESEGPDRGSIFRFSMRMEVAKDAIDTISEGSESSHS